MVPRGIFHCNIFWANADDQILNLTQRRLVQAKVLSFSYVLVTRYPDLTAVFDNVRVSGFTKNNVF